MTSIGAPRFGLGVVIEPVLREIDDDSLSRSGRQNMPAGHDELPARARQPGVDARIDSNQFLGSQAVLSGEIV